MPDHPGPQHARDALDSLHRGASIGLARCSSEHFAYCTLERFSVAGGGCRWYVEQGAAAMDGATAARIQAPLFFRAEIFAGEIVVVREFLPRIDVAEREDPDPPPAHHRFAVRLTRMVDEPRIISADGGIHHNLVVHVEEQDVRVHS